MYVDVLRGVRCGVLMAVLCCVVLCCAVLCCVVPCCAALTPTCAYTDRTKLYLFHELADLYLQLKLFEHAIKTIEVALNASTALVAAHGASAGAEEDLRKLTADVKSYMILAEVRQGQNLPTETAQALMAALELQRRIIATGGGPSGSVLVAKEQKEMGAHLCYLLAEHYLQHKPVLNAAEEKKNPNAPSAANFYNEALQLNVNHEKSRLVLCCDVI